MGKDERRSQRIGLAALAALLLAPAPATAGLRLETLRFFDPNPAPSPVVGFRVYVGPDAARTMAIDIGKPAAVAGGIRSYPLVVASDAEVYVAVAAYDAAGRESPRSNAIFRARRGPAFDHDADGASDLLRIDGATGGVEILRRGGDADPLLLPFAEPQKSQVVARGDFDGNGASDILWQRKGSRALTLWLLDADGSVDPVGMPTPGPRLRLLGVGDLDGDRRDDLIFQHVDDDDLHLWLGGEAPDPRIEVIPGLAAPWHFLGIGDVEADRRSDLVWWDPSSGALRTWHMNGSTVLEDALLGGALPTGSKPVGIGDYDGDGSADLLVRLPAYTWIAFSSLQTRADAWSLVAGVPDPQVETAAGHDFDADGLADLVLVDRFRRTLGVLLLRPNAGSPPPSDFSGASMSGDLAHAIGDSDNDWHPDFCDYDFDNDGVVSFRDVRAYRTCALEPAVGDCAALDQDGDGIIVLGEIASIFSRFGEAPCAEIPAP
jgi:hypothetical protein